jgi:hypothetical protein
MSMHMPAVLKGYRLAFNHRWVDPDVCSLLYIEQLSAEAVAAAPAAARQQHQQQH